MAASAVATVAIDFSSVSGQWQQQQQQQQEEREPLPPITTKTGPQAASQAATTTTEEADDDGGSVLHNGGSSISSSLDDRLTPFPPYCEREESIYEYSNSVAADSSVPVPADARLLRPEAEQENEEDDRSPTPIAAGLVSLPQAMLSAPAEAESSQAPATEPAGLPSQPPAATVRQAVPPPYWTHSDGGDGAGNPNGATTPSSVTARTTTAAAITATTHTTANASANTAGTSASAATAATTTTSPSVRFPTPYRLGALSLPVFRPPWSPSWPRGSRQTQGPSQGQGWAQDDSCHRRDNSASSANLITLQDNDAFPEEAEDEGEGDGDDDDDHSSRQGRTGATKSGGGWPSAATPAAASAAASRCWAQRVDVTGFVVVGGRGGGVITGGGSSTGGGNTGSGTGAHSLGSFVVWTIRVQTLQGGAPLLVHKRYSEFDALRRRLVVSFPMSCAAAVPPLPPKSVLHNFRPRFLEQRRLGLQYFLNCILLNPEFSGSPVLKEFLFS